MVGQRAGRCNLLFLALAASVLEGLQADTEEPSTSAEPATNGTAPQKPCERGIVHSGVGSNAQCTCSWPQEQVTDATGLPQCGIKDCARGHFNDTSGHCSCRDGFRAAGITNPFNFIKGACTQYKCVSDAMCQEFLGIKDATCPVIGWNCDCGLLGSRFWSAGASESAQCMYFHWALVSSLTRLFSLIMEKLWIVTLVAAVVLLPLGKNMVGTAPGCSAAVLRHDFAWSFFAIKLGMWLYVAIATVYFAMVFTWVTAIVALVLSMLAVIAVIACVLGIATLSGEGLAACDMGQLCGGFSCDAGCAECGMCHVANSEMCSSSLAYCCCAGEGEAAAGPAALYTHDMCWGCYYPMYLGDPLFCRGSCVDRCSLIPCTRWLVEAFPAVPENMLGGFLGFCVGTHPLRNRQSANSAIVRALSRPCWRLSNRSDRWRRSVYEWLHEREAAEALAQLGLSPLEPLPDGASRTLYGETVVNILPGSFAEGDGLFNHEDYQENNCWICQSPGEQWDHWLSCHHAFCSKCSGEMLRRSMPCPFCRVRSNIIDRRDAAPSDASKVAEEVGENDTLLEAGLARRDSAVVRTGKSASSPAGMRAPAPQQLPPSSAIQGDE
eukprot:TRINITY_DN36621_c0_g1_i2.p1 TRINITY_DN36621_c0_g1~~TRINITY_DN36621_c0_g1_i2.p1  ORF type:complete len:608 (-),score=117.72 TRINITY_DN36621_c0_g1_i2:317-2140(-)